MREEEEANKITQEKLCEKLKNLSDDLLRESDSRKLALLDLNQLRTEYSDLLKYNKELSRQTQEGGDSITLKIALERAKEAHKLALEKITYLETAYVNVVPKEEFSNVQDRLADSESENERLRANCEQLRSQLENISKDLAVVTSEKEEIADRYAVLRKTSTPRYVWYLQLLKSFPKF
uniref:HOOK domain-containing protein n=1 Tax=Mesocestoides corti TaxID=53468 RepID=A0A5K3FNT3_MESCO